MSSTRLPRPASQWFAAFARGTRCVNSIFALAARLLAFGIMTVILLDIAVRAVGTGVPWAYDSAQFALLYLFFLSLAPALESGHHIVIDTFDRLVPPRMGVWCAYSGMILTAIFGAIFCWQLGKMTVQAFADDRLANATIQIHLKWVYLIGPIGAAQFTLTALTILGSRYWGDPDSAEG